MIGYLQSLGLSINVGNLENYKQRKLLLISRILNRLNASPTGENYVLKGGTALLLCHGLDRFSEDIDLDGVRPVRLDKIIEDGCMDSGLPCTVNVKKDTSTVLRYMIDFQDADEMYRYPLKIEASFRNSQLLQQGIYRSEIVAGIRTYSISRLISMKFSAFKDRHAIRDFYDVCWMVNNHSQAISNQLAGQLWETLQYKNFDALVEELQEVAFEDHVMKNVNVESIALQMLERLPELLRE